MIVSKTSALLKSNSQSVCLKGGGHIVYSPIRQEEWLPYQHFCLTAIICIPYISP